jgi:FKBP-type peptidyl-prolyl cis-trans isomerase
MQLRKWTGMALFGLALFLSAVASNAEEEKEVPLPELPKGAGEIDKDPPKTFTTTKSGLKYRILRKGKAEGKTPKADSLVKVNYHGWLAGGKVFDSSYRKGKPITHPANMFIKGWTEGLQLISEGSMLELEIPAKLGYEDRGVPQAGIPPNARLHFILELIEVK